MSMTVGELQEASERGLYFASFDDPEQGNETIVVGQIDSMEDVHVLRNFTISPFLNGGLNPNTLTEHATYAEALAHLQRIVDALADRKQQ